MLNPPSLTGVRNESTIRGDDVDLDGPKRDLFARLDDGSLVAADAEVRVEPLLIALFGGGPMVEAFPDRDHPGERLKPSHVIPVEVRDDQVVNPGQAGLLSRRKDSLRVPVISPGEASIDEQRFPGGRHNQGSGAAFDVHPVDVEGPRLRRGLDRDAQQPDEPHPTHAWFRHAQLLVSRHRFYGRWHGS